MKRHHLATALVVGALLLSSVIAGVATVTANSPAIQVSSVEVSPDTPIVGETTTIETTISNLEQTNDTVEITDVYLRDWPTEFERAENVGSIAPGGSVTVPVTTTFDTPGEKSITVNIVVSDEEGDTHSYSYPAVVEVEEPDVDGGLSINATGSGETSVALTNYGNVNFSDVEIRALNDGEVRDQRHTRDVPPDESRSNTFSTEDYDAENVTFTATYTANGDTHELTRTTGLDQQVSGAISLTSVETIPGGSSVSIDGEAANVGGTDVESVLLRVQNADRVTPADGDGEYFVGSVDASEFATFELAASVENGTSSVPVEVSYLVDGERSTTIQTVDISSTGTPVNPSGDGQPSGTNSAAQDPPGGAGLPTLPILIGLIALLGASGGLYYLRNRE